MAITFKETDKSLLEKPVRYWIEGKPDKPSKDDAWVDIYYHNSKRVQEATKKARREMPKLHLVAPESDAEARYLADNPEEASRFFVNKVYHGYIADWNPNGLLKEDGTPLAFTKDNVAWLEDQLGSTQGFLGNIMMFALNVENYGVDVGKIVAKDTELAEETAKLEKK